MYQISNIVNKISLWCIRYFICGINSDIIFLSHILLKNKISYIGYKISYILIQISKIYLEISYAVLDI